MSNADETTVQPSASEVAAGAPGSTFLRCGYPWAAQDAYHAQQAHTWATTSMDPCDVCLDGMKERFARKDFSGAIGGASPQDLYWRWVWAEVHDWYYGYDDDSIARRAALAAALARECPFDRSNK